MKPLITCSGSDKDPPLTQQPSMWICRFFKSLERLFLDYILSRWLS